MIFLIEHGTDLAYLLMSKRSNTLAQLLPISITGEDERETNIADNFQ